MPRSRALDLLANDYINLPQVMEFVVLSTSSEREAVPPKKILKKLTATTRYIRPSFFVDSDKRDTPRCLCSSVGERIAVEMGSPVQFWTKAHKKSDPFGEQPEGLFRHVRSAPLLSCFSMLEVKCP